MMISATAVSYILLGIWLIIFIILKRYLFSNRGYFVLLLVMCSAGILLPIDDYINYVSKQYDLSNIILFSVLMIITLIPWIKFDSWLKRVDCIRVCPAYIKLFKTTFSALFLLCLFAIIYALPYGITALSMGGNDIRTMEGDGLLPHTFATTICTGAGCLTPVTILAFYITLIEPRLKAYIVPMFIASLTYLFTSMPSCARDGYIYIPLTYLFMYKIFKNSLSINGKTMLKKLAVFSLVGGLLVFLAITLDRFVGTEKGGNAQYGFIYGTWGYFFQQPYVFDQVLQHFTRFFGFNRRLKFLVPITGISGFEYDTRYADSFEWSFGTMYAEFYEMGGYIALFFMTIVFISIFWFFIAKHIRKKHTIALMIVFSIYLYHVITGLFYYRLGMNESETLLYVFLVLFAFLVPKVLTVEYKKCV